MHRSFSAVLLRRASALLFAGIVSSSTALAQPLLDKVEDQVRRQTAEDAATEPGYLGLIGDSRQEAGRGVRILEVLPGGPADSAGLKADDLIVSANDQPLRNEDDLADVVEPLGPGENVAFTVDRAGVPTDLIVRLGKRPPPDQRRFQQFGKVPDPGAPKSVAPEPLPEPASGSPLNPDGPAGRRRAVLGVRTQPVTRVLAEAAGLERVGGALVVARTIGMP